MKHRTPFHGLLAEFLTAPEILEATRRARLEGYRHMDAYTPYPVEGLPAELGLPRTRIPLVVLMGGLVGAVGGYFMQYWAAAVDYPVNIGGKPFNSWPAFIPITFEMMVLVAALSAILGMFFLNGLPQPYHPLFHIARFDRASQDRFFLCIEATDPHFDGQATRQFLESLHPHGEVVEVPH
jgi:Protein of unknown function (DUF3341)